MIRYIKRFFLLLEGVDSFHPEREQRLEEALGPAAARRLEEMVRVNGWKRGPGGGKHG